MGISFGNSEGAANVLFLHNWILGKKQKFGIGLGARATGYLGANQYYITAPARITSGSTGPGVFFKENIEENIDTFLIAKPTLFAFNAMINLHYQFNEVFSIGFNIDLIGFTLGAAKSGNYINGTQGQITNSNPTAFNLLLISDNDFGSLNSELYTKYKVNSKWSAKAGLQFLFTEYSTTTDVQQYPEPNNRFRNKSLLFMIGTSYKLN